jgi:3'(2'), 5'-bisphosphate nucleotidase
MKGFDDPVTIADIKAQTLIIRGIRRFWPDLRIVSEETKEFNGDLGFNI